MTCFKWLFWREKKFFFFNTKKKKSSLLNNKPASLSFSMIGFLLSKEVSTLNLQKHDNLKQKKIFALGQLKYHYLDTDHRAMISNPLLVN